MTVIAWDGKTLAADKQSTSHNMARTTTKIHRVHDGLVALSGDGPHAHALLDWFRGDREKTEWPKASDRDEAGHIIHITRAGVFVYNGNGSPFGEPIEDRFIAFGAGRDYAMAAMYLGCDALRAVEVACAFDVGCGKGIDTLTLDN
jgi:ATP-dependent protease HslVU (ClpYQ) peptidase subunit